MAYLLHYMRTDTKYQNVNELDESQQAVTSARVDFIVTLHMFDEGGSAVSCWDASNQQQQDLYKTLSAWSVALGLLTE